MCCCAGLLGTVSSAAEPARHRGHSYRGVRHRPRAEHHHSHFGRSSSSRAAARRAAAHAAVYTAQSHQTGVNPHRKRSSVSNKPPEKCGHGSISYIKCWLDEAGFVSGVAFESRLGTKGQSLCSTSGKHQEEAFLYDGETILDIIACRWVCGLEPASRQLRSFSWASALQAREIEQQAAESHHVWHV
jgi:hypothetical protein